MDFYSRLFIIFCIMKNENITKKLLEWYAREGRDLPWRVKGGAHPDPYVILVSELMLQQTTVKTVIPYFYRFMERFPTIQALSEAALDDVYQYWQGLGYYSRARSLHATAKMIVQSLGGVFPRSRQEVLKLKGIGSYTASSFLALAFNLPETVVDGNVIRIICRMYHLMKPVDEIRGLIEEKATVLTDIAQPADYASAIMDLGAMVCTPKNPKCLVCPWQKYCLSAGKDDVERIPVRHKPEKKEKYGKVYLIFNAAGEVFIRKRTEKGLLSGLYEFPWSEGDAPPAGAKEAGVEVSHVFTHFKLVLRLYILKAETYLADGRFVNPEELSIFPMSTLMKKVWGAGKECRLLKNKLHSDAGLVK